MAKTWKQKLEDKKEPKLQILEKPMSGVPAGGALLAPTAQLVKEFIEIIPPGEEVSVTKPRVVRLDSRGSDRTGAGC
ncbi:hypothetical protein ACQ4M3_27795 [Leptolyngbya sp. AN03gr2]|uniref:hypothetical protein n=1 Tax=unclassified Leptolyngbya TaxID=2650499 RepID=UPI003D3163FE